MCDRREGARGEQVRVYRLDLEQWAIAQEVLEYRRPKRESQVQSIVEASSTVVVTGGDFDKNINKETPLTTEDKNPRLTPEEVADRLGDLSQLVAGEEREWVQALWRVWSPVERAALLNFLSTELRRKLTGWLGVVPGAIVRSVGNAREWVVEFVGAESVRLVQSGVTGEPWTAALADLY